MFTQCPKCHTVFRLSPEVLRAAAGEVRCGRCGGVFNALSTLAEDAGSFITGDSFSEQEARADNILRFPSPPSEPAPEPAEDDDAEDGAHGIQIAHLEFTAHEGDAELAEQLADARDAMDDDGTDHGDTDHGDTDEDELDDRSLEFTLPPGELDRIFIAARTQSLPFVAAKMAHESISDLEPTGTHPIMIIDDAELAALGLDDTAPAPTDPHLEPGAPLAAPHAHPTGATPAEQSFAAGIDPAMIAAAARQHPERIAAERARAGYDRAELAPLDPPVSAAHAQAGALDAMPDDSIERIDPDSLWRELDTDAPPRTRLWIAAIVLLTVLFAVQWVNHSRAALAEAPGIGAAVRSFYAALGQPIPARTDLAAFDLRQWGVTGDTEATGILKVRASMINTAAEPQPYPLLRVTLADRFGARIGSRDFEPHEYLHPAPQGVLAAGAHADALLAIADPGKNAEGFEIDVCARNAQSGTTCANDLAARPK